VKVESRTTIQMTATGILSCVMSHYPKKRNQEVGYIGRADGKQTD
jgi:hypothetical protein